MPLDLLHVLVNDLVLLFGDSRLIGRNLVERLADRLSLVDVRRQYLAELQSHQDLSCDAGGYDVEWVTDSTIDEVIELQRGIAEFSGIDEAADGLRKNLESNTGRTAVIRVDGQVVSAASSAAESSFCANIIGVCTAKEFRNRGLATACMTHICNRLTQEGKTVCLFYENPAAGRIYQRLGFRDVGRWATARRQTT